MNKKLDIPIERVVNLYSKSPYQLDAKIHREKLNGKDYEYIFSMVPMDCVDDIRMASVYNPRRPKSEHRDALMNQIGAYGLIQPLVATLEKIPSGVDTPRRLYLLDGRHRYHALLGLDGNLQKALSDLNEHLVESEDPNVEISDVRALKKPKKNNLINIKNYDPQREVIVKGKKRQPGAVMIPVKIYLEQDEVGRIGMAVFLNKARKKLAPGEEISRIANALDNAFEAVRSTEDFPSEIKAVQMVEKSNPGRSQDSVVLSYHVGAVLRDPSSIWFQAVGRWQGDEIEDSERDGVRKKKPITALNFLNFIAELIDATPRNEDAEHERLKEVANLERLGVEFKKAFSWPSDFPTIGGEVKTRYTPTAILSRSFLLKAIGSELNSRWGKEGKLLSGNLERRDWQNIHKEISYLYDALQKQSELRINFEKTKRELDKSSGSKREKLVLEADRLRGKLWSLDTVSSTLERRLGKEWLKHGE